MKKSILIVAALLSFQLSNSQTSYHKIEPFDLHKDGWAKVELYDKFSAKYKAEKYEILTQIESLSLNLSNLEKSINKYCNLLMNVGQVQNLWSKG